MTAHTPDKSRGRRHINTLLGLTVLVACVSLAVATGSGAEARAFGDECDDRCHEELAEARAATAQYHREERAVEDGFVGDPVCVQRPGFGAMGIHYLNRARMNDTSVDPAEPEILLYEPEPNGRRRLVGVEYWAPVIVDGQPWFGGPQQPPPAGQYNAAPVLFGRTFNGPMPGHGPGMPWHYDLHVWAWRHNPSGMFAQFNPKVSCQ